MRRVFFSFAYEDLEQVRGLLPLFVSSDYDLGFYEGPLDADIDSKDAGSIKRAIGEKITKCNVTVCLVGENTHKSKWVDCQLQKSRNKGNRIIAMALEGTDSAVLPAVIREENLTFYPWNSQKLGRLIMEETPVRFT